MTAADSSGPQLPGERAAGRGAGGGRPPGREPPHRAPPPRIVHRPRSSLEIVRSVWTALLLREALTRLFSGRAAWFWLMTEPIAHIAYLMVIFTVIRVRHVGGMETAVWIMTGLLAFFAFRRTATQCMNAVHANNALFTYRQVKPIDTVLTRGILEGVLLVVVSAVLVGVSAFFGMDALPDDPLAVLAVFTAMWLLGLGFGLVMSVVMELLPELGRVVGLAMTPLYFASGLVFPIATVPPPYRTWIMANPLAHGVEAIRSGFASHYHAAPETSITYMFGFALVLGFFGMALHHRMARRLVTR